MLQKKAIEPGALELLKALQADTMFSDFHLAGGRGLALQLGYRLSVDLEDWPKILIEKETDWGKMKKVIHKHCLGYLKNFDLELKQKT